MSVRYEVLIFVQLYMLCDNIFMCHHIVPHRNGFFGLEKIMLSLEGVFIHHENRQPSNFPIKTPTSFRPTLISISLTRQVFVTNTLPLDEFRELARAKRDK